VCGAAVEIRAHLDLAHFPRVQNNFVLVSVQNLVDVKLIFCTLHSTLRHMAMWLLSATLT